MQQAGFWSPHQEQLRSPTHDQKRKTILKTTQSRIHQAFGSLLFWLMFQWHQKQTKSMNITASTTNSHPDPIAARLRALRPRWGPGTPGSLMTYLHRCWVIPDELQEMGRFQSPKRSKLQGSSPTDSLPPILTVPKDNPCNLTSSFPNLSDSL